MGIYSIFPSCLGGLLHTAKYCAPLLDHQHYMLSLSTI